MEVIMKKQILLWMLVFGIHSIVAVPAMSQEWAIKADIAESCSCNAPCPCFLGSPSTHDICEGTRLVEIKEGHYGNVSLDGIDVLITLRLGEWVKYYVSDKATIRQVEATENLLNTAFSELTEWGAPPSTERVHISVKRTATTLKFTSPNSTVEIEMMEGRNGKPIKIKNLPGIIDYTQYKSVENSHHSKEEKFSYSGTNGITANIEANREE
mgnify:CR=1 FL=1